jgi:hypothetical protein
MRCPKCHTDNLTSNRLCVGCGSTLKPADTFGSIIKIVCLAALVGSLGGLVFPFSLRIFSIDQSLSLWEFLVSFVIAIWILNIFVLLLSTRIMVFKQCTYVSRLNQFFNPVQCKFVGIPGTLTLIIPLLGPLFGGTGKEPIWQFAVLGIVGCLVWSIPLFAWFLISLSIRKLVSHTK